jgi:hypothetical protein
LLALLLGLTACAGTPRPYVLLVAVGGQHSAFPDAAGEGATMIAPLGCKVGVGEACLPSVREGDVGVSADGRRLRLGHRTHAWNCDTHDLHPAYYATFESDVRLPGDSDQLVVLNGASPMMVDPRASTIDVDLDGDGVAEHVALENRNSALSITNGRTGAAIHVKSASGLSIVHLVGAADVRGDGRKLVIFSEGRFFRAVGADGHAFALGFGCFGV